MDFQKIGNDAAKSDPAVRPMDKNLVLQLDADFACYECARIEDGEAQNWKVLKSRVYVLAAKAGAGIVNVHVTLGMKGGRVEMATVAEYQVKRGAGRDPAISHRVHWLREQLANWVDAGTNKLPQIVPQVSNLQEADDYMSQLQLERMRTHGPESTAIMSGDKDLWMVDGRHCDPKTGRFWEVSGFGKTEYRDVGNTKDKLVGEGTSWFWHQLLMGDKVDNIPGLPELSGRLMDIYVPVKTKPKGGRKAAKLGEAKAVAILSGLPNDKMAARAVLACYREHYGSNIGLSMMVEQAFLLWMRRTNKLTDCVTFLNESGIDCAFTERQKQRLRKYVHLARNIVERSEQ